MAGVYHEPIRDNLWASQPSPGTRRMRTEHSALRKEEALAGAGEAAADRTHLPPAQTPAGLSSHPGRLLRVVEWPFPVCDSVSVSLRCSLSGPLGQVETASRWSLAVVCVRRSKLAPEQRPVFSAAPSAAGSMTLEKQPVSRAEAAGAATSNSKKQDRRGA